MSELLPTKDELKQKALLVPCETKEDLHRWVKVYLGLNLPSCTIDPTSTSNPMDMLWKAYQSMMVGDVDNARMLFYAARDCFKTILSSVIELLAILHMKRNVAHMAAIETQSKVCAKYLKKYANLPYIRDYVSMMNERRVEFTRYESKEAVLSPKQYAELNDLEKNKYTEVTSFVQVVIATLSGANGIHAQCLVLDELDIAPRVPVEESKMICSQEEGEEGKPAVTLMTSSRKFAAGLVQEEIDDAEERGTKVFHWNIIDCSRACPTTRHLPEEPQIDIYYSEELLRAISTEQYKDLTPEQQEKYQCKKGYSGCLKNCRLFSVCQGRLATQQTSKSSLLKSIPHVQNLFRSMDKDVAKAQLMCWKPSSYGLIYPHFDPDLHLITAARMAWYITGEEFSENFSKNELVELIRKWGGVFYAGMDHGYTHNFAVVTGAKVGNRFYVLDCISAPELELSQKIEICNSKIKDYDPIIFADPEDPASNKTLKRYFKLRDWKKTPGSVVGGITTVRYKLLPPMTNDPELFFLKNDEGVELLCKKMSHYRWILDKTTGKPTDIPDDEADDEMDALRYCIMNVFKPKGKSVFGQDTPKEKTVPQEAPPNSPSNWMEGVIRERLGDGMEAASVGVRIRKGSLIFDL